MFENIPRSRLTVSTRVIAGILTQKPTPTHTIVMGKIKKEVVEGENGNGAAAAGDVSVKEEDNYADKVKHANQIASPMASKKLTKKCYKLIKKGMRRGVFGIDLRQHVESSCRISNPCSEPAQDVPAQRLEGRAEPTEQGRNWVCLASHKQQQQQTAIVVLIRTPPAPQSVSVQHRHLCRRRDTDRDHVPLAGRLRGQGRAIRVHTEPPRFGRRHGRQARHRVAADSRASRLQRAVRRAQDRDQLPGAATVNSICLCVRILYVLRVSEKVDDVNATNVLFFFHIQRKIERQQLCLLILATCNVVRLVFFFYKKELGLSRYYLRVLIGYMIRAPNLVDKIVS